MWLSFGCWTSTCRTLNGIAGIHRPEELVTSQKRNKGPQKNKQTNKLRHIACWKDKSCIFKGSKKKINSTSSAFRDDFCKVGRQPKHYWKHSKTNKRLLRARCCEGVTAWCRIGGSGMLWNMNFKVQQKEREVFPVFAKQYFDKILSKMDLTSEWKQLYWFLEVMRAKDEKTTNEIFLML